MEGNRVGAFEQQFGTKDTRLSEASPMLDARFDKDALGNSLRNGIVVVNANVYRVSRPSPMETMSSSTRAMSDSRV